MFQKLWIDFKINQVIKSDIFSTVKGLGMFTEIFKINKFPPLSYKPSISKKVKCHFRYKIYLQCRTEE